LAWLYIFGGFLGTFGSPRVAGDSPSAVARHFTILIVEDDREERDVIAQMLSDFKVLTANDGYEAIRLLVAYHVDVMLTDIAMPGLSGYELAAQAKLVQPRVRILFATGFDGSAPGKEMASGYGKIIQKPFRAGELHSEIEQVLKA
jgi:CheY-like chemotaxis protein